MTKGAAAAGLVTGSGGRPAREADPYAAFAAEEDPYAEFAAPAETPAPESKRGAQGGEAVQAASPPRRNPLARAARQGLSMAVSPILGGADIVGGLIDPGQRPVSERLMSSVFGGGDSRSNQDEMPDPESMALGASDALTLGHTDEALSTGRVTPFWIDGAGPVENGRRTTEDERLQAVRARRDAAIERDPQAYGFGNVGGIGAQVAATGGGGLLRPGASVLSRLGLAAGTGLAEGAVAGSGYSDADIGSDEWRDSTLIGAGAGGALGLGGAATGEALSAARSGIQRLGNRARTAASVGMGSPEAVHGLGGPEEVGPWLRDLNVGGGVPRATRAAGDLEAIEQLSGRGIDEEAERVGELARRPPPAAAAPAPQAPPAPPAPPPTPPAAPGGASRGGPYRSNPSIDVDVSGLEPPAQPGGRAYSPVPGAEFGGAAADLPAPPRAWQSGPGLPERQPSGRMALNPEEPLLGVRQMAPDQEAENAAIAELVDRMQRDARAPMTLGEAQMVPPELHGTYMADPFRLRKNFGDRGVPAEALRTGQLSPETLLSERIMGIRSEMEGAPEQAIRERLAQDLYGPMARAESRDVTATGPLTPARAARARQIRQDADRSIRPVFASSSPVLSPETMARVRARELESAAMYPPHLERANHLQFEVEGPLPESMPPQRDTAITAHPTEPGPPPPPQRDTVIDPEFDVSMPPPERPTAVIPERRPTAPMPERMPTEPGPPPADMEMEISDADLGPDLTRPTQPMNEPVRPTQPLPGRATVPDPGLGNAATMPPPAPAPQPTPPQGRGRGMVDVNPVIEEWNRIAQSAAGSSTVEGDTLARYAQQQIAHLQASGARGMSFGDALAQRRQLQKVGEIANGPRNRLNEQMQAVAEEMGRGPQWRAINRDYANATTLATKARAQAERVAGLPSPMETGIAAMTGGAAIPSLVTRRAAMWLGPGVATRALEGLSTLAARNPAALGSWTRPIQIAMQRGPAALAATFHTLSQTDPKFREFVTQNFQEGDSDAQR